MLDNQPLVIYPTKSVAQCVVNTPQQGDAENLGGIFTATASGTANASGTTTPAQEIHFMQLDSPEPIYHIDLLAKAKLLSLDGEVVAKK